MTTTQAAPTAGPTTGPVSSKVPLTPEQLKAFGEEMDAIRQRVLADLGEADAEYIRKIPRLLLDSGVHVPVFVCMEAAIPGTPLFNRMAASETPGLMPHCALHDFTGYTLVMKPRKMTAEAFTEEYRWLLKAAFAPGQRIKKIIDDFWWFLRKGSFDGLLSSWLLALGANTPVVPGRTHIPETDIPFPERVPLTAEHFDSQEAFEAFMKPTMVTDSEGHVLPQWRHGISPLRDSRYEKVIEVMEQMA